MNLPIRDSAFEHSVQTQVLRNGIFVNWELAEKRVGGRV